MPVLCCTATLLTPPPLLGACLAVACRAADVMLWHTRLAYSACVLQFALTTTEYSVIQQAPALADIKADLFISSSDTLYALCN